MRYMLLIFSEPGAGPAAGTPDAQEEFGRWFSYSDELQKAGVMVAGGPLQDGGNATSVRVRNGEQLVTDGPFAETKEHLGGYYLIDVPDLDTAVAWAAKMPNIAYGTVEVRPLMEIPAEM